MIMLNLKPKKITYIVCFNIIFILKPVLVHAESQTEKTGNLLQILLPVTALGFTLFHDKGGWSQDKAVILSYSDSTYHYEFSVEKSDGRQGAEQFAKSLITAQLITGSLKSIIHKERPNGNCCDSFPSGHATAAFVGAAFIQKRYGWTYAIPAYLGAAYTGYSRVDVNKHFTEDVVAGAAIGIFSSFYFTKQYKEDDLIFEPIIGPDGYGIGIRKSW